MKERKNRDQIVLATKYTIGYKNQENDITLKVCLPSLRVHIHLLPHDCKLNICYT